MAIVTFTKMNGAGNDFVMIDHRDGQLSGRLAQIVPLMCHRHFGVGADGVILIENASEPQKGVDFKMRILNADGSEAEMCGNGARCAAVFAHRIGAASATMNFETLAGPIGAHILDDGQVRVNMSRPTDLRLNIQLEDKGRLLEVGFINTGVPHAVVFVQDVAKADVVSLGRLIRYHEQFAPAGTNVNIVALTGPDSIAVRTYERGVEGETFACGTGATAAAILAHVLHGVKLPVTVAVKGGVLKIEFEGTGSEIQNVIMQGPAEVVFEGGYTHV